MTSPVSTVRYGKVTYRVLAAVGDGPDADVLPDRVPVTGSGWLTPRVDRIIDRGSEPTTVLPRPIPVVFEDGRLSYRGSPWVWLLATDPGVWRWHAQLTYNIGGDSISDEFFFDLLPGDPEDAGYVGSDLSTARVTTDTTGGLPTMVGPAGRSVLDVQLVEDGLLFVMSQGADIQVMLPALADLAQAAESAKLAQAAAAAAQQAVASVGTSADDASAAAVRAETAATAAEGASAGVSTDAAAAAWSAGQAAAAATAASGSESAATTKAGEAATSATAAAGSAASIVGSVDAATAAQTAAETAAGTATAKATAASGSADTATAKATEAAASAAAAAQSAEDAASVVLDGVPNASATVKGGIRLAGDLAGTWDAPTVPGLASKASTSYVDQKVAELVAQAPETLDTLSELAAALGDDPNFATTIAGQIGAKADAAHSHAVADVSGLQTALDGKAAVSHAHAVTDVTGLSSALAGKADTAHTHTIGGVTGLQEALDEKAAASHAHTTAQVTGLDTALAGKAPSSHTHVAAGISDSSAVGRGVLTAADAAAARAVIGAVAVELVSTLPTSGVAGVLYVTEG